MEKALTIMEVSKILSLSPITVYRLARKGEIPAVRVGRCWRFTQEAINKWLAGKPWEQKLETLLEKMWRRTDRISADKVDQEIKKAVKAVRGHA
ncbi:helix-turn-helix domain-containing protein [Candidatus Saganbacteria bacterium]|nr:helix-turn-helix domain-containing protein [Candidatus Saganbacteria bacterium]